MAARILCVGDLHLGRIPSRLPHDLDECGLTAHALSPAAAWDAIVDYAGRTGVAAVLLAGDVVESEGDFYESYTLLDRGVRALLAAGIQVLAVAGNHDVGVLPRLDDAIPGFQLLGRGGRWDSLVPVQSHGTVIARVLGWSFGQARVESNPLTTLPSFPPGPPVLGLLHCDVDVRSSPYAPVPRFELEATTVAAWLLGHIHKPDALATMPRPIGYLGSVVGLDPTESGPHGPWLLTVEPDRITAQHVPLAPLLWDTLRLDVSEIKAPQDLNVALTVAIRRYHDALLAQPHRPRAVGLRVELLGRNRLGHALHEFLAGDDSALTTVRIPHDAIVYFVERVTTDGLRPAIELAELARNTDPPAIVARTLLLLDRPPEDPDRDRLLRDARDALARQLAQPVWRPLPAPSLSDDDIARWLRTAGWRTLDALLAQRAAPP